MLRDMSTPAHPLRDWRTKAGRYAERDGGPVSQEELAGQAGVVPSHLSQIETGLRSPSLALAARLSSITGIEISEFVQAENAA